MADARPFLIWLPALAQMAAIFFASSLPNLMSLPGGISDKTGHFLGYGLLSMLVLFEYVPLDDLVIVAVGDGTKIRSVLAEFGTVDEWDSEGRRRAAR